MLLIKDCLKQECTTCGLWQYFMRSCTCNSKCKLWRPCMNKKHFVYCMRIPSRTTAKQTYGSNAKIL